MAKLKTVCINSRWRNKALWIAIFAAIPTLLSFAGLDMTAPLTGKYEKVVDALLVIATLAGAFVNPSLGKGYQDDI